MSKTLKIALLALFMISPQVLATLQVRVEGIADDPLLLPLVRLSSAGESINVITQRPAGDATSSNAAVVAFVPIIQGAGAAADARASSVYSINGSTQVNAIPNFTVGNWPGSLRVNLEVTITSNEPANHYLHAAVQDAGNWIIVGSGGQIPNGINRQVRTFEFDFQDLCDNTQLNCQGLATSGVNFLAKVYYFLSPNVLALGDQIDPSASPNNHGVYYNINLSSRIHPSITTNITQSFRSDASAFLSYTSTGTIQQIQRAVAYFHSTIPVSDDEYPGQYTGLTLSSQEFPALMNGELTVEGLVNDQENLISVAVLDNYNFSTRLSAPVSVIPQKIEEILSQESCFIVTAGFGRDHQVIQGLKRFRDHVLLPIPAGKALVSWYYQHSPQYARALLDRPLLRAVIRFFSWTAFGLIHYLGWILMGLTVIGVGLIARHHQGVTAHGRTQ